MIEIGRRLFLRGLISVPIAIGLPARAITVPALQREPYVRVGQGVSYIGLNLHPAPCFTGSYIAETIGDWNGSFYPVTLDRFDRFEYIKSRRTIERTQFPDHDLAVLHEEVPRDFWHSAENNRHYPNVHAWLRQQRFGEHPDVMRAKMKAAARGLYWPFADQPA